MVVVSVGDLVSENGESCMNFLESLVRKLHFLRRVNFFVQLYVLANSNIVGSLFPTLLTVHKNICLLHKVR